MRLVIFGAGGRTGNHLVRQAVSMGHDVTAFVRRPNKLPLSHERLRVIIGDARDQFGVERGLQHADAVINVIALGATDPEHTLLEITHNIINGMKKHGITRFVGICDTHIQLPNSRHGILTGRLQTLLLSPSANRFARISQALVHEIARSNIAWSMVRTHQLSDEAFTGQYVVDSNNRTLNARVSRANAADFMLRIAVNGSHINDLPIICNS
jgi:D-arabinose 1-dehydrogenase-like Zn-dependent alcohol dehydrogenase